jgi:2'-deoxynucleoside 5'-phosphate N-hydrolase
LKNIYFAGAIRGGRGDAALYLEVVRLLDGFGHVLTEHVGDAGPTDAGEGGHDDRWIHERDLKWLRSSEYLVAEVTTPSLGVGYEIGKATEWGTPVLCLFRPASGRKLSAMIAGSPGVTVREYSGAAELKEVFEEFFRAA